MLMHILEFFEGDLHTEQAWKVKFAHLVPLHTVSTYSILHIASSNCGEDVTHQNRNCRARQRESASQNVRSIYAWAGTVHTIFTLICFLTVYSRLGKYFDSGAHQEM